MSEEKEVLVTEETEQETLSNSQANISIRKLNTSDFWALLKIIQKGGKEAFTRLKEAEDESQSVIVILDVGMEYAEKELQAFLAGISQMTEEEFKAGDFDLTLTILEKWQEQEDLAGFFKRAANFIKKFLGKK